MHLDLQSAQNNGPVSQIREYRNYRVHYLFLLEVQVGWLRLVAFFVLGGGGRPWSNFVASIVRLTRATISVKNNGPF